MSNAIKAALVSTFVFTSCQTMRDSMLVGATAGAAVGGFVGNQVTEHSAQGTAIGVVTGGAFGALFGYLGFKEEKRKEADAKARLNALKGKPQYPSVSVPEVRAVWVPDKIENDQFVSGHYIYQIQKPATFKQE